MTTREILAALTNELDAGDPLSQTELWQGQLFEACNEASFDGALRRIWSDLQKPARAKQTGPPIGYLWEVADRPPNEIMPGDVLTGQRATVVDLRRRYFANRPEVYGTIAASVMQWLQKADERQLSPQLRFLWIGGRSGTGKSIVVSCRPADPIVLVL